jgi:hypothetical protein
MEVMYKVIENGSEEVRKARLIRGQVVNLWHPSFCLAIPCLEWTVFVGRFFPSIVKHVDFANPPVSRFAAAQMAITAAVCAASQKQLGGSILKTYLQLGLDPNELIRKAILSSMKLLIPKLDASQVEPLFYAEVGLPGDS